MLLQIGMYSYTIIPHKILDKLNVSETSFYSSQGRQTSFPDKNETLIDQLLGSIPKLATFEVSQCLKGDTISSMV